MERLSMGVPFNTSNEEYVARINRVLDYIQEHLDRELSLEELAGVAHFSKYHFHRIFYSLMGESLFQYILRLRLERAASSLLWYPRKSVTRIAHECGFSGASAFARSFRERFAMSATNWRKTMGGHGSNLGERESNACKGDRKEWKAFSGSSVQIEYQNQSQIWRIAMDKKERRVEVKNLDETQVAYVRYVGPYKGDAQLFEGLFERLLRWAGPRGLVNFPETKCIVIYHDDPEITPEEKLRVSACITVPKGTMTDGEVGSMSIQAGRYAMARFELLPHEYGEAWAWVFSQWFPNSGYQCADGPCFELYQHQGSCDDGKKAVVDICVPVKPL
ncbi:MAG: AraC family transcriptional regulator [Spirochaetes bacterium]|nr:AraC family transcriptional regulator [Spirochaetota bacterium]